jgi:hypothetical protein
MKSTLLIVVLVLAVASGATAGSYTWGHGTDLQTDPSVTWQDTWLVYLYGSDTASALPTQVQADLSAGGYSWSGASTTIQGSGQKSGQIYSSSFSVSDSGGDVGDGDYVITIAFDTSGPIVPGLTQWTTFDGAGVPVTDSTAPGFYTTSGYGGGWATVVPEPTTWALFGLGALTLGVIRRKPKK